MLHLFLLDMSSYKNLVSCHNQLFTRKHIIIIVICRLHNFIIMRVYIPALCGITRGGCIGVKFQKKKVT